MPSKPYTGPLLVAPVAERGRLLFEYRPPRAHPIVYAGLMLFGFVFVTGAVENLLRQDSPTVYAAYALPLLLTAFWFVSQYPSDIKIHQDGIAPARPLWRRWHRPFVRWDDLVAVYPTYYDVTGAFVSPFASSDGKVTQMGLGLERADGRVETVRFTPSRFTMWQPRSRGYKGAMAAVRHAYAEAGRPLTPHAETFTPDQQAAMAAEARRPFLPFFVIVALFASAAPVLWLLTVPFDVPVGIALPVSLLAPLGTSLQSHRRSRARNRILNRLSKAAEYARGARAVPVDPARPDEGSARSLRPRSAEAGGAP